MSWIGWFKRLWNKDKKRKQLVDGETWSVDPNDPQDDPKIVRDEDAGDGTASEEFHQ